MSPELESARVAKALTHPTRIKILELMKDGAVRSPNSISEEIGEALGNVSYHVKALLELECVVLVKTEPRRGAVEHFYRSTGKVSLLSDANIALDAIAKVASRVDGVDLSPSGALMGIEEILAETGRAVAP